MRTKFVTFLASTAGLNSIKVILSQSIRMPDKNTVINVDGKAISDVVISSVLNMSEFKVDRFSGDSKSKVRKRLANYDAMANTLNWSEKEKMDQIRGYLDGPAYSWYVLNVSGSTNPLQI